MISVVAPAGGCGGRTGGGPVMALGPREVLGVMPRRDEHVELARSGGQALAHLGQEVPTAQRAVGDDEVTAHLPPPFGSLGARVRP